MPTISTTLVSHESKSGTGQKGAWTLHVFKNSSGQSFKTFEAPVGNKSYGLLNQPVVLTYGEKPAKDPQYPPDFVIQDVQSDLSAPVTAAPVAPQAPPTSTLAPVENAVSSGGYERELRIMRQSALERALRWFAFEAPEYDADASATLYAKTEEFIHYFQTGEYPGKSEAAVLDEFAEVFPA